MSPEQPKPMDQTPEIPNVRDRQAMIDYIKDLSERLKRDRHQVGPVKARMMEKRLKKLKRIYGVKP